MDIFSPSGMILWCLINKTSKIRIPKFSNSFFSKVAHWYIEHYSTVAMICSMCLHCVGKVSKSSIKSCARVDLPVYVLW